MTQDINNGKAGKGHPPKDTRWKPGQSGNPKGRPKNTVYVSEMLREQLDKVPVTIDGEPNTKTWRDLICESILRAAVRGNQPAITKELLDRIEGKVTERHDITSGSDSLSELLLKLRGYGSAELADTKLLEERKDDT